MNIISNKPTGNGTGGRDRTLQALNENGLKITSQRALILEVIRHGEGHMDADEVYRQARKKQPRLSLSTVYRNLQTMKRLGVLEEVHLDETHHHYEIKSPTEHYHLVCLGCGRVIEFQYPLTRLVKRNITAAKDFEITGSEFSLTGYCPACRESKR